MTLLNLAKVIEVLLVFSCQNQMEHFVCALTIEKGNSVTKTDSFPVPRMDDGIDNIGQAKYVTKFDLLYNFGKFHSRTELRRFLLL